MIWIVLARESSGAIWTHRFCEYKTAVQCHEWLLRRGYDTVILVDAETEEDEPEDHTDHPLHLVQP